MSELERMLTAAAAAHAPLAALRPAARAGLLRRVAVALESAAPELVPLAREESHLPEARLTGELKRTTFQLRFFADVLLEGSYLEATLDAADPNWPPGPRPDLRRMLLPLGPIVVFAASNFPFAFSVAGGDTASALAAGCPVVIKAHPGHPRLSDRTAAIVSAALRDGGAPDGSFALVHGDEAGRAALLDPRIKAGAFTGSTHGGRALFDLASSRPVPIPFYAEMGSVNPVFVTEAAATARGAEIATGYLDSYTLGAGQFCTKPGFLFVPESVAEELELRLVAGVLDRAAAPLLNERIAAGYTSVLRTLSAHPAVRVLHAGTDTPNGPSPTLLGTTARALLADGEKALLTECFGPTSVVVRYGSDAELPELARLFTGELTATVHGEAGDAIAAPLLAELSERAGRVLWNGWPTGVAVSHAMHHGGPYPSATSALYTSVGSTAIRRFLRPVCYQNVPQALLPEALRDDNPLDIPRWIEGSLRR
ncbi:aldehyde dehydrogenase (NADP(+)) [Pendulispora rubella]|uniref:Aldehyde dehydrogenase (NADP(+)) n=1 Tax=Pendulispora rubella TaxID=2741070 RepID=A0ABZ2L858_9BACT